MKIGTLIILTYSLIVAALIASVKVTQAYVNHNHVVHEARLADCGDPPPPTPGGE